jgi:hypothetical protein
VESYCGTTLLPYSEVVELQHVVHNSAPVSRRIATGPAVFIESNAIVHKTKEGAMNPKENEREPNPFFLPFADPSGEWIADPKLINEAVEWLATEVKRRPVLKHHDAVKAVVETLGPQAKMLALMTQERDDRDGSMRWVYRFTPPVLQAFRKRTGKAVRWGKHGRYWMADGPKQARSA